MYKVFSTPSHKRKSAIFYTAILFVLFVMAGTFLLSSVNKNSMTTGSRAAELPILFLPTPTTIPGLPCPLFPADNVWNRPVTDLAELSNSALILNYVGSTAHIAPGFGRPYHNAPFGQPVNVVPSDAKMLDPTEYPIEWVSESDPHPYPVPPNPLIQETSDKHMIIVQSGSCTLYEFWHAKVPPDGATNEVTWDLRSNAYHDPARQPNAQGVTSADAAGLPMLPGLLLYNEVTDAVNKSSLVKHALRTVMNVNRVKTTWVWPAYHTDGLDTNANSISMGARIRLRADYPETGLDPYVQVIVRTLKEYGMILADTYNGDNYTEFGISGEPDNRWPTADVLNSQLNAVKLSDFIVVDESGIMVQPNSMQARIPDTISVTPFLSPTLSITPTFSPSIAPTISPIPPTTPLLTPFPSLSIPVSPSKTATPVITITPTPTREISLTPTNIIVTTQAEGPFLGIYYNDRTDGTHFANGTEAFRRNDETINFNWNGITPGSPLNTAHYSVRWQKQVYLTQGTHQFTTSHDDGERVYLEDVKVYDNWKDSIASTTTFYVSVASSGWFDVMVEYYQNTGPASIILSWK